MKVFILEKWFKYVAKGYGSLAEFNKLDYSVRYQIWEEYINGTDVAEGV